MRRKLTRILLAALLIGLVSLLSACGNRKRRSRRQKRYRRSRLPQPLKRMNLPANT